MSSSERLRVLHMVPGLGVGGAEQMAGHLMVGLCGSHDVSVVSLYPPWNSSIEQKLMRHHIPIWYLGKRPGFDPRLYVAIDRVLK